MRPTFPRRQLAPILLAVLFGVLLVQLPRAIAARTSVYEWFDPVIQVRRLLVDHSVFLPEDPEPRHETEEAMRLSMIEGLLRPLEDDYAVYVPPSAETTFNKELRGTYVGIGAEVLIVDDMLTIVSPMDGSPALEAGILAGDVVLEIAGETTLGLSIDDCIDLLVGEAGTDVRLLVRHLDGVEEELVVTRRRIVTPTVKGIRRLGETWDYCLDADVGIAYVRVSQFNDDTVDELRGAIEIGRQTGLNGLVLDLRDDPGGGLDTAVEMVNLFLDEGTIVSVRGRGERHEVYRAKGNGTYPFFPMVVLVNQNSASASEIVAGALQENGRAKVLGVRSYGKGSVQEVRELEFGQGTLKFTTAMYYLPSGRNINRIPGSDVWGVDPDPGFVVPVSREDYAEMIRKRREFEVIREIEHDGDRCPEPGWIIADLGDLQLDAAVRALRARLVEGAWPEVGAADATAVALGQELELRTGQRARLMARLREIAAALAELLADAPLLPRDVDLENATLTLRDRFGNHVGSYRLEDGDLELALSGVELEPVDEPVRP